MRKIILILLLAQAIHVSAAESEYAGPMGVKTNCTWLHSFTRTHEKFSLRLEDLSFGVHYSDWTPEIAQFLKDVAGQCALNEISSIRQSHQQFLRQFPNSQADFSRNINEAYSRRDTTINVIDAIMRTIGKLKIQDIAQRKMVDCTNSEESQAFQLQEAVIGDVGNLNGAKKMLARERKVAETSGVRNLTMERNYGEMIVDLTDRIKITFDKYKQHGGKASAPERVGHDLSDPCASLADSMARVGQ